MEDKSRYYVIYCPETNKYFESCSINNETLHIRWAEDIKHAMRYYSYSDAFSMYMHFDGCLILDGNGDRIM